MNRRIMDLLFDGCLLFVACGSMLIMGHNHKIQRKEYQEQIVNICNKVGYNNPEQINSFSKLDINNYGLQDVSLTLKDGSKLEYISKGYELKK